MRGSVGHGLGEGTTRRNSISNLAPPSTVLLLETLGNQVQRLVAQRNEKGGLGTSVALLLRTQFMCSSLITLSKHFNFPENAKTTFVLLPPASKNCVPRFCRLSLAKSWTGPVWETKAQCRVPTFSLQKGLGVHRIEVGSRAPQGLSQWQRPQVLKAAYPISWE